jgi:DNA polymerase delta subunit 2
MYFLRLAKLKPEVEKVAEEAWADFEVGGELVRRKDRVLDVRQGEFCWVVGTIYMEMPLKPNILDDISRDHWISAPQKRKKYISSDGEDQTMLEDESGRIRLVGNPLKTSMLVTGCIVAVMGTENSDGEFEIIDMKVPDLPRQPQRWERDNAELALNGVKKEKNETPEKPKTTELLKGSKIAFVSGLEISGDDGDSLSLELLMEYLLGEGGGTTEPREVKQISRLVVVGNSVADAYSQIHEDAAEGKKTAKKYGYDAASYNPTPTAHLDNFLATLLPSIPITLIPGETDPANASMPQQPIHPALMPHSRAYSQPANTTDPGWFHSVTNPWEGDIDGWRIHATGGQPIDDVFKYVQSDDRIDMMECLLRWRCTAPTAPDTLWCYPFQETDPFVLEECPHIYVVGNQPRFESAVIEGPLGQAVCLIALPKFRETGELVILDTDTLTVETITFGVEADT